MATHVMSTPKQEPQSAVPPAVCQPPRKRPRTQHPLAAMPSELDFDAIAGLRFGDGDEDAAPSIPDSIKLSPDMFDDIPRNGSRQQQKTSDWLDPYADIPSVTLKPRRPLPLRMSRGSRSIPLQAAPFSKLVTPQLDRPTDLSLASPASLHGFAQDLFLLDTPASRAPHSGSSYRSNNRNLYSATQSSYTQEPVCDYSDEALIFLAPSRCHASSRRPPRRLSMKDATRAMEESTYEPETVPQESQDPLPVPRMPRRLSLTSLSSHGIGDFPELNTSGHDFAGCA